MLFKLSSFVSNSFYVICVQHLFFIMQILSEFDENNEQILFFYFHHFRFFKLKKNVTLV